jgi:cytochrome c
VVKTRWPPLHLDRSIGSRAFGARGTNDQDEVFMQQRRLLKQLIPLILAAAWSAPTWSVDDAAAQALLKKNDCLKCHAVDKKKDGPSFKETAAKYKGKADGEQKVFTHVTTSPKIKVDGKEEEHKSVKGAKEEEVKNLVQWILSR